MAEEDYLSTPMGSATPGQIKAARELASVLAKGQDPGDRFGISAAGGNIAAALLLRQAAEDERANLAAGAKNLFIPGYPGEGGGGAAAGASAPSAPPTTPSASAGEGGGGGGGGGTAPTTSDDIDRWERGDVGAPTGSTAAVGGEKAISAPPGGAAAGSDAEAAAAANSQKTFDFLKDVEGFDPVSRWDNKQYTVGHGHKVPNAGIEFTREQAAEALRGDIKSAETYVDNNVRVPMTPEQRAALTSFTFNLGSGNTEKLIGDINQGKWDTVANRMLTFNHARDRDGNLYEDPGLTNRRWKEVNYMRGRELDDQSAFPIRDEQAKNRSIQPQGRNVVDQVSDAIAGRPGSVQAQPMQPQANVAPMVNAIAGKPVGVMSPATPGGVAGAQISNGVPGFPGVAANQTRYGETESPGNLTGISKPEYVWQGLPKNQQAQVNALRGNPITSGAVAAPQARTASDVSAPSQNVGEMTRAIGGQSAPLAVSQDAPKVNIVAPDKPVPGRLVIPPNTNLPPLPTASQIQGLVASGDPNLQKYAADLIEMRQKELAIQQHVDPNTGVILSGNPRMGYFDSGLRAAPEIKQNTTKVNGMEFSTPYQVRMGANGPEIVNVPTRGVPSPGGVGGGAGGGAAPQAGQSDEFPANGSFKQMSDWSMRQEAAKKRLELENELAVKNSPQAIQQEAERKAAVEDASVTAKTYAQKYDQYQKQGDEAYGEIDSLKLLKNVINDPNFYSGYRSGDWANVNRIMSSIGLTDNQVASVHDIANKLAAGESLLNVKELGPSGPVRVAEMKMIENSNFSPNNTKEANQAIVEMRLRLAERMTHVSEMAQDYIGQHGRLDRGWDKELGEYKRSSPLFNSEEMSNWRKIIGLDNKNERIAPSHAASAQEGTASRPAAGPWAHTNRYDPTAGQAPAAQAPAAVPQIQTPAAPSQTQAPIAGPQQTPAMHPQFLNPAAEAPQQAARPAMPGIYNPQTPIDWLYGNLPPAKNIPWLRAPQAQREVGSD